MWYGELDTFSVEFISYCSGLNLEISLLVIRATRVHPVPFRTRKLSSSAPMVLGGQPPGRVGHRQEAFSFLAKLEQKKTHISGFFC